MKLKFESHSGFIRDENDEVVARVYREADGFEELGRCMAAAPELRLIVQDEVVLGKPSKAAYDKARALIDAIEGE